MFKRKVGLLAGGEGVGYHLEDKNIEWEVSRIDCSMRMLNTITRQPITPWIPSWFINVNTPCGKLFYETMINISEEDLELRIAMEILNA